MTCRIAITAVIRANEWLCDCLFPAYEFWQRTWCDAWRQSSLTSPRGSVPEPLSRYFSDTASSSASVRGLQLAGEEDGDAWAVETALDAHIADSAGSESRQGTGEVSQGSAGRDMRREAERRWCEAHSLVLPSLLRSDDAPHHDEPPSAFSFLSPLQCTFPL